jgi:hypothetical protein
MHLAILAPIVAFTFAAQVEFDAARSFLVPTSPRDVAAADFDEDGARDIAIALGEVGEESLCILFGDGTGGFEEPTLHFTDGERGSAIFARDLDGDGHADVVVAHETDGTVAVLLGDGAGGFSAPATYPLVYGRFPKQFVPGDFNEDSILDLALACTDTDTVVVLLGDGAGALEDGRPFVAGDAPTSLTLFNGTIMSKDWVADYVRMNAKQFHIRSFRGNIQSITVRADTAVCSVCGSEVR